MARTLSVVGCGSVGRTLCRLWTAHDVLRVRSVLNRTLASGRRAVQFIGAGQAVESFARLEPADAVMISTSDEAIAGCCRQLCEAGMLGQGAIVFHCSGALPSAVLEPARSQGAAVASLHPIKSFPDPATAAETFSGTFCAIEGDAAACEMLRDALRRIGGVPLDVAPQSKTIYHAAAVFVCNYLVALMEIGLRCFEKAGVPRETALEAIRPIVTGTVENVFRLGPVRALTGLIARGEASLVADQCEALGAWDKLVQQAYKALGRVAVELSAAQGNAGEHSLAAIRAVVERLEIGD